MQGREYYTDAKSVPATGVSVWRELSGNCKGIIIIPSVRSVSIKTLTGEVISLGNVTSTTIFPYKVLEIKSDFGSGILANLVYELF